MKRELQKELIDKYPKFFEHLQEKKIFIGEKSMMEEVKELVDQTDIVVPMQFGFECNDGWFWLLDNLMKNIYQYCEWNKKEVPDVLQIKEKYGALCFYHNSQYELINGMVWFAEHLSRHICETCGTTINVGGTKGWIYTCCELCREKDPRKKELEWSPND